MLREKSWKQFQLDYLEYFYKEKAEAWKNEHNDKKVYSNSYFIMVEAINSLPDEPNNFVIVAMNNKINEYEQQMQEIDERFKMLEGLKNEK